MTIIDMLQSWGGSQDAFQILQVNAESSKTWSAQLRTTQATAAPGLDLCVRRVNGDERVWMSFQEPIPEDVLSVASDSGGSAEILPRLISAINDSRAGSLIVSMGKSDGNPILEMQAVIYEDGFSRHMVNVAVLEIAKGYDTIQRQYAELRSTLQLITQQEEEMSAEMQSSLPATKGVLCSACNAANPRGSRFCNQCGAPLECTSCGARNPPGSRFCNQCGTSLGSRQL